ncbi:hypothetical protein [Planktosalinus lacus]|uniref:Uncharacterized protein n=1 Tax=Planktosalinus lacus TaxID=1526573 RepID=A0A8J2V788_9FLAO|nr:hypothetical protein [Planktosalinus lacus]GGD80185.1 hypothetical protein GCM10011312_00560 [Planktosalinus lacus]
MSNTPTTNSHQEEIDLGYLINKINELFIKCLKLLYAIISFFLKHKYIILLLIVIGIAYSYFKEKNAATLYDNQAIVVPNFESVHYLYDKIDAINFKIGEKDSLYLKSFLGEDYKRLKKVEIEPIIDMYQFLSKSRENIDIFRIITQNQDITDYKEELSNNKYYKYHKLNLKIFGENNTEGVVSKVLDYLNNNEHLKKYSNIYKENNELQIKEHKKMLAQIDSVLYSIYTSKNLSSNQGVQISENPYTHFLIERKGMVLDDLLQHQIQKIDFESAIKIVKIDYNLIDNSKFRVPSKIKYPLLLVFLYSLFFFLRYGYSKLKKIANSN